MKTLLKKSFKGFYLIALFFSFHTSLKSQGNSLSFNGSSDYVQMASMSFGSNWTAEAWINPTNVAGINWKTILGQSYWNGPSGFVMAIVNNSVFVEGPTGFHIEYPITANVWTHVAATYNNGIFAFYVNGTLAGVQTGTFTNSPAPFFMGMRNNNNILNNSGMVDAFAGNIDEVRIWNTTRSQCEIKQYMNCEIPSTATNLMANYHFNQCSGNAITDFLSFGCGSLTDVTGNGHHGTLSGFVLFSAISPVWSTTGSPAQGLTTPASASTSEIDVRGNGNSIVDGTAVTSATNHTDFNGAVTRTFVIQNTGTQTLNVGTPVITGSGANQFSVTVLPANSLAALTGTTSFVVAFTPTSLGVKNATVNIYNLDCSEPFYNFVITATAVTASALNFDGVDDRLLIGANLVELGKGDFTMEAWIKTALTGSNATNQGIIVCSSGTGTWNPGEKCLFLDGLGRPVFVGWGNGYINGSVAVNDALWHHLAVVWDYTGGTSGVPKMYVDGVDQTVSATTYTANNTNVGSYTFRVGESNYNPSPGEADNFFRGEIDEVRIWDRVLCQPEIVNNMNCELPSPTSQIGLRGYYQLNQGIAYGTNTLVNNAIDASASGINAFLLNFARVGETSNWVGLGGVVSSTTCSPFLIPDINILGNSNVIPNNNATTSSTNATNYSSVALGSATSNTFLISNFGTAVLNISSYTISGSGAANFSITSVPPALLGISNTTNMVITFSPTSLGLKTATVSITTDACHKTPYTFVIEGTGASPGAVLHFDGINDKATVASGINLNNQSFTIEFWAKRTGTGNNMVVGQGPAAADNSALHVGFRNTPGNEFTFAFYNNDINYTTTASTDGNYHHWACVYDAGAIVKNRFVYLDGILVFSDLSPSPFLGTGQFVIGDAGYGGNPYEGYIDELRVWGTARTQCEIQTYMNCEIPTTAAGLLANYHFNQGIHSGVNTTYTTLIDATGSHNSTLSSFALIGGTSNWISPGGVVSGYTTTAPPTASISLSGNSNPISNNSAVTSTLNYTDFGSATTRTFVIQNSNTGTLNIGVPYITGANAAEFSVTVLPTLSLTTSATTSFVVAFTPASNGVKSATVNINDNDCNIPLFKFTIEGTPPLGEALDFTGASNYITATGHTLNNQSFSIEFYAKRNNNTTQDFIFGQGTAITNNGLHIGFYDSGIGDYFVFDFWNSGLPVTHSDYLWHHWACVFDASATDNNRFIYRDGILVASDKFTGTYTGTGTSYIGSTPWAPIGDIFTGRLDELRIWGTARTQCEIQTFMNCEIPANAAGLISNYHFNQGAASLANTTVTSLTDASGNNHHGTLNSFTLTGSVSNWVSPGGVISGYTTSTPPTASITLSGNSNPILNNSISTSTLNFTNFGNATTRTFVIQNNNTGTLNIGVPYITGANAAEFSVTVLPTLSLTTSATTSFVVAFTPTSNGVKSATVNINDNDCNIPLFKFAIEGIPLQAAALSFDGINDYVDLGNGSNLKPTSELTAEAWVYMADWTIGSPTFVGNTEASGYALYSSGTDLRIIVRRNGTYAIVATPLSSISAGWHHIAGTFDGRYTKLYLDGVLKNMDDAGATYSVSYIGNNTLLGAEVGSGSTPSGSYFAGKLDEVRIWSNARSQCEILSYMNCEIPTTATGLLANYHFNQGAHALNNSTVSTLIDASGNANTGTLTGLSLLSGTTSNWVAPGGVVSGYTTAIAPTATISLTGNSNAIAPGSTIPSLTNFTDFGSTNSRTFVIQSTGGGTMYINSPITLSGANASEFSVTSQPTSSITTGTTSFVVVFTPTTLGTRTAVVNVNTSDCTNPNYSFVITASATAGSALHFDGLNDRVTTPVFNTLTNNLTLQAKVFWTGNNGFTQMVSYNGNSSNSGYGIYVGAVGTCSILFGGIGYYNGNHTLTPNVWTSLTMVLKNGIGEFYVNGVLTNSFSVSVPNTPNANFNIGCNSAGSEVFNGTIDEVLLWSRALTQCEIQAYLTCEIATSASSLVANYHFNQGIASGLNSTVTTLTDASGNNNNLTLTNFNLNGLSSNWTGQGAVTSGSSCPAFVEPDINVISNALTIADGNTVVATTDNTDFGNITTTSVTVKSYTIQNTGNGPLTVSTINMSGADASQFVVGPLSPVSPISASSSAVFSVTFAPTSAGTKTATLNIVNNDCDEANYDFVLSGSANVGAALSFNNSASSYVNCGNILTPSYTKEAWIKIGASTNGNNFLSGGSGSNGHALWAPGINLYKLSAGHDLNWAAVQDASPLSFDVWYHVAVTYDASSNEMTLYKNGVSVSNNTVLPFSGSNPLSIGGFGNNFTINGSMDEVRIWNRALCASEILNNMNCEIPTTAFGLIANYHFNQGVGYGNNITTTIVTDASGSANTATLVNFAATGTLSNWVPTSTITTGSSCAPITVPEINVIGNGITINDGASAANLSNHTDFGGVCVNGQVVRTYTIQNTGTANLSVSSISVGGVNASLSNIGPLVPSSTILPNNSAVFSVTFTPTSSGVKTTTLYILNNDCDESPYDFVMTGTCNPLPVVSANTSNSVICNGFSTILNGGGADTYTWTGGVPTITNGVSFTPSTTLTYTVIGTNTLTGCTSTNNAVQTITVNPSPSITASTTSLVICNSEVATFTMSGANNYSVNTIGFSGSTTTVSPPSTTSYSVTGTSSLNCIGVNTVVITITVNPLPVVTATASNPVICNTATTSVIGSGANTYTWTGGVLNNISFTPSVTATYSVSGTNTLTGCTSTNSAVQTITVDIIPTVSITAVSTVICVGGSATLTASGASTYTWSPGNITTSVFNPTPNVFSTYSVIGTSSAGCTSTNTAAQSISVNALPSVTASISSSIICEGETITLTGSGASTYTWTGGAVDGVAFTPVTTSGFTLSGTNAAGCTNTNSATTAVTVNALPSLTITSTNSVICIGDQTTLNGSGALTYTYSNGITNNVAFTPTNTTTYTLSGTDANTCENMAVITITVNNLPILTVSSSTATSCEAQTVTLTASGASSYSWNTTDTTSSIVISPTVTSTYSIIAIDANTCTNTTAYTQSVIPCLGTFTASASKTDISCNGKDDGIIAISSYNSYNSSNLSYSWSPSSLCPNNNCDSLKNLKAGTYNLTLILTYTVNGTLVKMDTLVLEPITLVDLNGQCVVKVYTGITPNNDGKNDVLTIENIEEFPNNTVTVFNRWGQQVYQVKGYNNLDKAWPMNGEETKLSSNTFFYIIDLGTGDKLIKGWIELIKN